MGGARRPLGEARECHTLPEAISISRKAVVPSPNCAKVKSALAGYTTCSQVGCSGLNRTFSPGAVMTTLPPAATPSMNVSPGAHATRRVRVPTSAPPSAVSIAGEPAAGHSGWCTAATSSTQSLVMGGGSQ